MKNNLFVVVLRYLVPLEKIDAHKDEHWKFLDRQYGDGIFIASGPQEPRNGGIIIAKTRDRPTLEQILKDDPFSSHNLAEYQIFEFTPTRHSDEFGLVLEDRI